MPDYKRWKMVLDIAMCTRESAVQLGPAIPMADAVPCIVRNVIEVVYLDTVSPSFCGPGLKLLNQLAQYAGKSIAYISMFRIDCSG